MMENYHCYMRVRVIIMITLNKVMFETDLNTYYIIEAAGYSVQVCIFQRSQNHLNNQLSTIIKSLDIFKITINIQLTSCTNFFINICLQ